MSFLSYLYPIILYRSESKWNNSIVVREVNGVRELYVNNVLQSGLWYRNIWNKLITSLYPDSLKNNASVLVLGLGGGDAISVLNEMDSSFRIEIVEIDPEIILIARKYFQIDDDPYTTIVHSDAALYLRSLPGRLFELIIIDLYQGDKIPGFVTKIDFLTGIKSKLSTGSTAIFNYNSGSFTERKFSEFEGILGSVFSSVKRTSIRGHIFFVVQK
jgi:spermidine synthase